MKNVKRPEHSIEDQVHDTFKATLQKKRKKKKIISLLNYLLTSQEVLPIIRVVRRCMGKLKSFFESEVEGQLRPLLVSPLHLQFRLKDETIWSWRAKIPRMALKTVGTCLGELSTTRNFQIEINSEPIWILSGQKKNVFDVFGN